MIFFSCLVNDTSFSGFLLPDPYFFVWCFVDRCFSFCLFSFNHCIICPRSYLILNLLPYIKSLTLLLSCQFRLSRVQDFHTTRVHLWFLIDACVGLFSCLFSALVVIQVCFPFQEEFEDTKEPFFLTWRVQFRNPMHCLNSRRRLIRIWHIDIDYYMAFFISYLVL
jgi:hypothetical protein